MVEEPRYRLADSTLIEPLVNSWSASSYLLSPATASLFLLNYQTAILRSYLAHPEIHAKATRDPSLVGGPFVGVPPSRVQEVRKLLEDTERGLAHNLEFARSLVSFQTWLLQNAHGQSLEPYYERVPDPLRGYVELFYDYEDRPALRLFEGLLYDSPYYNPQLQSLRLSRLEKDGGRPFFMNTPRLLEREQIDWKMPFDAAQVDALFALDTAPQPLRTIRDTLSSGSADDSARLI